MPRRYFRRRRSNRDKYSIENTVILSPSTWTEVPSTGDIQISYQFAIPVVRPSDVQGMRKAKHFTLSFSCDSNDAPVWYALVYVPEGYNPNNIQIPFSGYAISMYEPNQYVMSSGVLDFTGGPLRVKCPLSRNLNSGDTIQLIMAVQHTGQQQADIPKVRVNAQYAITLQ